MKTLLGFFCLFVILQSLSASADENGALYPNENRPKIGLVLSGGGAKGIAHIGVLKVLEELGIRPDYIAGTSMGSIVGGLYAIGYSVAELDSITTRMDWSEVLSDNISLYEVSMEEKAHFNNYISEFTFDENKGLSLPSGLIQGQKVHTKFSSLAWRVAGISDFDDYPIPFRCVATNLLSGKPVVFSEGDLVSALRASMSIPSVFAPVKKDSLLLIDGGVTRNYPVEEVIRMGADIVIGVYVGTKRQIKEDELQSLIDILGHTGFLGGVKDSEEQMKLVDIEIIPDMTKYGSDNFSKAEGIIEEGKKAAIAMLPKLEALAESQKQYEKSPIKTLPSNDSLKFSSIVFRGNKNTRSELLYDLSSLEPNIWYKPADINRAIERLYGTGYFDKVTYHIVYDEDSLYMLTFNCAEKAKGAIKFAVKYDSYFGPAIRLNMTLKNTILKNDKLFVPVEISPNPYAKVYYQKSMNNFKHFSVFCYGSAEGNEVPFYSNSDTINVRIGKMYQSYLSGSAGVSISGNTRNLASIEWQWNYCRQAYKEGLNQQLNLKYQEFQNYKLSVAYEYNSYDRRYFPNYGRDLEFRATTTIKPLQKTFYLRDSTIKQVQTDEYHQVFFRYTRVYCLGALHIMPQFITAYTWGDPQNMDYYFLGGDAHMNRYHLLSFYGYKGYKLSADAFYIGSLEMYQEVGNQVFISCGANYARFYTEIDEELKDFRKGNYYGGMLGLGMLTKIGPIWGKWSQVPGKEGMLLINLGFQL